jgi:hypothetical protein
MIERRYPIQTVLANRKMFAGGGVVSPQQTAAPVQPSGGILSSSAPLMEAVAADAVNPAGGSTMVEAVEFNEGGVVQGFQDGGTVQDLLRRAQEVRVDQVTPQPVSLPSENLLFGAGTSFRTDPRVGDTVTLGRQSGAELGASGPAMESRKAPGGEGYNVENILSPEAEFTGGFFGPQKPATTGFLGLEQGLQGPGTPAGDVGAVILNVGDQAARSVSRGAHALINLFDDYVRPAFTEEKADETEYLRFLEQKAAVNEALRRLPSVEGVPKDEIAATVISTAKQVIDVEPNVSGEKLTEALGQALVNKYETPYRQATELASDEAMVEEEQARSAIDRERRAMAGAEAEAEAGVVTGRPSSDKFRPMMYPEDAANPRRGSSNALIGEADADEKYNPVSSSGHANQSPEDTYNERPEMDTGSNPYSVDEAIDEFTRLMPEYKGSQQTAGMRLLMLAAAIGAETSEHGWVNISKGVLKGLPAIIKGQEDAEKYSRSVKMAATKYALTKRDKLETERRLEERTRNTYFLDKPLTITNPDGTETTYNQGWNRFSDSVVNQINTILPKALVPLDAWKSATVARATIAKARGSGYEKSSNVKARLNDKFNVELKVQFPTPAARAAGAKPVVLNPSALTNGYFEAVGNNDSLLALANSSAELLSRPNQKVTGFNQIAGKLYDVQKAYFGDNAPNLLKSMAISDADGASTYAKTISEFSDANRYNTQLRFLAIQMAPLLLGESGKTISDGDRRLIATALGLAESKDGKFKWIESASISRGELLDRVNRIQGVLRNARKYLDNNFSAIIKDYGGQMPDQRAISVGSQRAAGRTLSPLILTKEKDEQGRPIYDIRRRVS